MHRTLAVPLPQELLIIHLGIHGTLPWLIDNKYDRDDTFTRKELAPGGIEIYLTCKALGEDNPAPDARVTGVRAGSLEKV